MLITRSLQRPPAAVSSITRSPRPSRSFLPISRPYLSPFLRPLSTPSTTTSTTTTPRNRSFFIPLLTPPEEDDLEHQTYRRMTAQEVAAQGLTTPPTRAKMLVRDFIDDSLYNPRYGYFSKQAVIFSPEHDFDFAAMRDHLEFLRILRKKYVEVEEDFDETDEIARQVWHTPTELFKPYYGYAIAKFMVTEYKLNLYPHRDLIIYEMGAGNGTLMLNILDYIQQFEPSVYERTRYRVIEISGRLAERQAERQIAREIGDRHRCVEIVNKSIFEWDEVEPNHCFFLAMEVIDNFAHDLIRYDPSTYQPYQALVSISSDGDYTELYEPIGSDPLISRYLNLRRQTFYRPPVLSHPFLLRLRHSLPFAPNLTRPEFIPTKLLLFLETLHSRFPLHRLVLSDFYTLPNTIAGNDAPVVQTRYRGTMVPCSTYMVQPGYFDIFFPTNFDLLKEVYRAVCRARRPEGERGARVVGHRDFLERYADVDRTRTRSGENPMLMYYANVKMLLT